MYPKQILKEIGHQMPNVWNQVKIFRTGKGKDLPNWPNWCYLPLAAGYAIATSGGQPNARLFDNVLSPAVITAAASWRVSQGIYRFDADLYNSLVQQPLDGNLPCEVLKRIPEWCVYIETINSSFMESKIEGFWAHLENDMNDGRMELRLVLMGSDNKNIPIAIHLGDWTLQDGINRMIEESNKQMSMKIKSSSIDITEIVPFVQLVLYLCSENMDIATPPTHPSTRVRMSGNVDAPKEPRIWTVGERVGTSIRKYRNQESQKTETETHASPRPHVRRAHWHHFWTGSKEERHLVLRWPSYSCRC